MECIDLLLAQLDNGGDLARIRCEIADLITHTLQRSKEGNNILALTHLTNAVGSLTLNVNASRQPTPAGLHTCLIDLQHAIAAIDANEKRSNLRVKRVKQITYDMLIEAVQAIRGKVSPGAPVKGQAA